MRTVFFLFSVSLLGACGSAPPAADPTATPPATTSAEPECKSAPVGGGDDFTACLSSCALLDGAAPEGSRCMSPKADCSAQCNRKFTK